MGYKIGIDVGSTTVKVVVLSQTNEVLFRAYERHYAKVREKSCELLLKAKPIIGQEPFYIAITGSAGLGIAQSTDITFVQEVFATKQAVRNLIPQANCVVELGGEDAKIIFLDIPEEARMNGSCAGGTGAFIDQMATLIDVNPTQMNELSKSYQKIYPIASRCGVFAKTDIQPILNQGGRKEDIAVSVFQAVVDQTIAGLAQGRKIVGNVVFLGGPLHFFDELRNRFKETLNLSDEQAICPENSDCFAAIGAAYCVDDKVVYHFDELYHRLSDAQNSVSQSNHLKPLFENRQEYETFKKRHNQQNVKMNPTYKGKVYLGIDAGSTTTKLVLISDECELIYQHYTSNKGNPVQVILQQLTYIYEHFKEDIQIVGSAVTGYGEELIQAAFKIDQGIVETVAHYKAAQHFNPNVDFIIDIGGQDIKCFKIRNHSVDSIMLNEACSSGCGSFIETFAKALNQDIAAFASLGLFAKSPVNLGSRCTIFMNSSVKQAQKEGASIEDISAGLSMSVVKNALYKVIRASSADDLGENIVVQGGTFYNDAVLRSFELELNKEVTRPTISGIMGAFGAALYAKSLNLSTSTILNKEELSCFYHKSTPTSCGLCTNNCSLIINQFDQGRRFISGNRCSRPLGKQKTTGLNLANYKYNRLRAMHTSNESKQSVGLPFGLNMYENLPFWHTFFKELDYNVVISSETTRELYTKGQQTIPSDTVCYPAKVMHGHIIDLIDKKVDMIFYPCMPYNFDEGKSDNHYNCPVVAYYPELLSANVAELEEVSFLMPYFDLSNKKSFTKMAIQYFTKELKLAASDVKKAIDKAYIAYEQYRLDIQSTALSMIQQARNEGKKIIVVAGRPYHIDPEISHGIYELIESFDFVVITEDAIAHLSQKENRKVLNQWTYQARLYAAASYIKTQPDMELVHLVSFGCGIDAITADETRSILEEANKLYTQIKIDEINNLGAVKIRIRSLIAAIKERNEER